MEYQLYVKGQGDSLLFVFTGGSCDELACVDYSLGVEDSSGGYNNVAAYEFFAINGQDYWFLLNGEDLDTAGQFELKVLEYEIPSNDKCVSATEISVLPSSLFQEKNQSTRGATSEMNLSYCGSAVEDSRAVWYRLLGHGALVKIEYQTSYEGGAAVYNGSCPTISNADSLICYHDYTMGQREDEGSSTWIYGNDILTSYEFVAEDGEIYFILLSGSGFDEAGSYNLTISESELPTNDICKNTVSISPGTPYNRSTAGATADFDDYSHPCAQATFVPSLYGPEQLCGVWYSFTGNEKLIVVSFSPFYQDAQLFFFSGPCDSLSCEGNYDAGTPFGFVPTTGKKYHLYVTGSHFHSVGNYSLLMEQFDRPANDDCGNSVTIANFPFKDDSSMKGALTDFSVETAIAGCGDVGYSGVWYSMTGTGKTINLEFKTEEGVMSDHWSEIAVFQGQCGQLMCVIQEETEGTNAFVTTSFLSTLGAQYKVLLGSFMLSTYEIIYHFSATEESI